MRELAREISRDYAGKELLIVAILKGSIFFFSDLLRHITNECAIDFISVSSYRGSRSQGTVKLVSGLLESPAGRHVLVVEDIADTGQTLSYIRDHVAAMKPASVRICALLDKTGARRVPVKIHYRGFNIPEKFVVGYGLDYRERYRQLPFIGILKPELCAGGNDRGIRGRKR